MVTVSDGPATLEFGRFRVVPHRRQLLADGRPVRLGGRTFDLLMTLIEASGGVVSKDQLLSRVWPDRIVEENRLQGEISALRKAFGADRELIHTVSGRGYQTRSTVMPFPNWPTTPGCLARGTVNWTSRATFRLPGIITRFSKSGTRLVA
jgi:hypothetical protein